MGFHEVTPASAESYLNAQLGSLWENAAACLKKLDPSQSLEKTNRMFDARPETLRRCFLSQLTGYYISFAKHISDGHYSEAIFDKPTIEIICNHEILLKLRLELHTIAPGISEESAPVSEVQ